MAGKEYTLAVKIAGKVDKSVAASARKAQGILGSVIKGNLIASGISTAVGALKDFAVKSVETYTNYEQSITNAAATAGATGADFDKMAAAAREAGKSTSFTAAQSADALGYMALAGWDVNTSTQALMPVLRLAETTQQDLAATSDLVTDSMSAMGVGVKDLDNYMDVLIKTNDSANTSASQLMEAFIGTGAAAKSAGMSYKETSVALGILANNGIKGAEAGTALNSILLRTSTKEKALKTYKSIGVDVYDASGKMRDFKAILQDTAKATDGMTEAKRNEVLTGIAGVNYYAQYQMLLEGVRKEADGTGSAWEKLQEKVDNAQGSLVAKNAKVMATMQGAMKRFSSAVDEAKIKFFEAFGPKITKAMDWLSENVLPAVANGFELVSTAISISFGVMCDVAEVIGDINNFLAEHEDALTYAAIAVGTLGVALLAFKAKAIAASVASAVDTAITWAYVVATDAAATSTGIFAGVLAFLTSPITLVIAAIGAVIAICAALYYNWDTLAESGRNMIAMLCEQFPWASDIIQAVGSTIGGVCENLKNIFAGVLEFIRGVFSGNWSAAWNGVVTIFKGVFGSLVGICKLPLNAIIGMINAAISGINSIKFNVPDWVPGLGGKTVGVNIPKIPLLASGGIATSATQAIIGEGSEPEAVLPLSKLSSMLSFDSVKGEGVVNFSPVININGSANEADVKKAMSDAYAEFKKFMGQYQNDIKRKRFA